MKNEVAKNIRHLIEIGDNKLEFLIFHHTNENETQIDNVVHTHSFAELFYCIKGSIQLNLSNNIIILDENDIAIIPSGLMHTKYTYPRENAVWGTINLVCSKIKRDFESTESIYSNIAPILHGNAISVYRNNNVLCSVLQRINEQNVSDATTLLEFAYNFYKALKDKKIEKLTFSSQDTNKNIDRLILIDNILNTEYMQNFSVEEISERLYLSKRQFSRLMLKHYGSPFGELIKKRRLSAAANQLLDSSLSVEEICYLVGFSNKTVFYKYFKNEFGVTPAQYKKLKKGSDK